MAPQRKRDKPRRTYGKRPVSAPDSKGDGPPTKKRRLGDAQRLAVGPGSKEGPGPLSSEAVLATKRTEAAPTVAQEGSAKRTSILSYFRPIPLGSSYAASTPVDELPARASSPPIAAQSRRKPRVLRLRAAPVSSDGPVEAEAAVDESAQGEDEEKDEGGQVCEGRKSRDTARRKRGRTDPRDPLQDGGDNLINQRPPAPTVPERNKRPRPQASQVVQTTLNISAQAAFSECKVCDSVWNPLYPDDVKYHTKRHATVLRARRREKGEAL